MGHVYMLSVHSALGYTLQQWDRITKRLGCIHGSGPEVIHFVLYSSQLSMNFILRRINECLKIPLTFISRLNVEFSMKKMHNLCSRLSHANTFV